MLWQTLLFNTIYSSKLDLVLCDVLPSILVPIVVNLYIHLLAVFCFINLTQVSQSSIT